MPNKNEMYKTVIPNILVEIHLNHFQLATYLFIKRICDELGECKKSLREIAKGIGINIKTYRKTKQFLSKVHPKLGRPLILVEKRVSDEGDRDTYLIRIIDMKGVEI